jgi:hypothetical protein
MKNFKELQNMPSDTFFKLQYTTLRTPKDAKIKQSLSAWATNYTLGSSDFDFF